jgi:hypothetical protein
MPSYTGHDNRLCAGCKTAEERAKNLQAVKDTETARQIGRTESNVEAIPLRVNRSLRNTMPDAIRFFNSTGLSNSEDVTQGNRMMDYKEAAETIKHFNIPRNVVARLSGMHLPDISAWLGGKIDISDEKRERVSQWVADVAKMIQAMGALGIKPDLGDIENVRRLIVAVNDAEAQLDFDMPGLLTDLTSDLRPVEQGRAAD